MTASDIDELVTRWLGECTDGRFHKDTIAILKSYTRWLASNEMDRLQSELTTLRAAQQWRGIENKDKALEIAARDLLASMSSTYRARNGRKMGIEADDGEKCWIVHSDQITGLEAALALSPAPQPLPPPDGHCEHQSQPGPCSVCGDMR